MMKKGLLTAASAWLALTATAAHAQAVTEATKPCLTRGEITATVQVLLPGVLHAAADACMPMLGDDAFLPNGGQAMLARYDAAAEANAPLAAAGIKRVTAEMDADIPEDIDPTMFPIMISAILGPMLASKADAETCGYIDRGLAMFAPMPPENLAGIALLGIEIATKGDGLKRPDTPEAETAESDDEMAEAEEESGGLPFTICPTETAA